MYLILDLLLPISSRFGRCASLFWGKEIQKSNSGGVKDRDEIELYLQVHLWNPVWNGYY